MGKLKNDILDYIDKTISNLENSKGEYAKGRLAAFKSIKSNIENNREEVNLIKKGDVVRLKSCQVAMTVKSIIHDKVECQWMLHGILNEGSFDITQLVKTNIVNV